MTSVKDAILEAHKPGIKAPARLNVSDVFAPGTLESYVENGLITCRYNEDKSLAIYKYSDKAGSIKSWDEVTILVRGMIVDTATGEIVARGFNKFFSLGQYEYFGISVDTSQSAISMTKEDGSMGIAYYHNGQWSISTLSSFQSDQAIHATKLFREKYGDIKPREDGVTLIFEIIYPEGRIVTDYHGRDTLVLVGGADKYGRWVNPDGIDFNGDRVNPVKKTVQEILDTPDPKDTSEGFVFYTEDGMLVKHKFDSYLEMHKAKFCMTPLFVWEKLKENRFEEMIVSLPDEFQTDIIEIAGELIRRKKSLINNMNKAVLNMPENLDRKHKALWIKDNLGAKSPEGILAMQKLVAGRDPSPTAWDMVRPSGNNM